MKLTPRFTLVFIIYAIALLAGVGLFAYISGQNSLRSTTITELEGTALRKEDNLSRWFEAKKLDIIALSTDPNLVSQATTLLETAPTSKDFQAAHTIFIANIEPRMATSELLAVSLLHPQTGRVVASTSPEEEGQVKADQSYFVNGKAGSYVENPQYSSKLQAIIFNAAAPLYTDDGHLLGVLAAQLDPASLDLLISRRTNLHETDDAYLVDTSGIFITQPRLLTNPAAPEREVHTEDIGRCVQGQSGVMETIDYRNVPSFVVYRWLPDRQLCLIVKIDRMEAYEPISAFGRNIAIISVIALLVAAALAIGLAHSLTRPILNLQSGVAHFASGELDLRLDETARDELGQLAGEFNKMAEALAEEQTLLRRRAEQFFNLSLDLLAMVNASGQLLDLNPAWEQTLGYSRAELRGQLLTNLVHPEDLEVIATALQHVTNEAPARFECRCRHKDGHYRWLAWVAVLSTQNQLLYMAARDITESQLGKEKLRQQAEELEHSNRELEQFAQIASNDLQEPLRLVSNYVQLLARRYQGKLDSDADEFIGFTLEATNRMKNLLTALESYSKAGAHTKELGPVPLEKTLQRVQDNLQLVIEDTGTVITHDALPEILGDDIQMVQVFQNLIENAIKFRSVETPRIHIGVRQLGKRWLIFVHDNGMGIDPQYTERVFGIFQRLHNPEQYSGTGIGLAIARKIIERHGGRIWVDSEPGKGATFYFTLQPTENRSTVQVPGDVIKTRPRDTVADRAKDLI